jgi:putative PIN family toxin of toxin-antitoxin system
MKRIRVVVDTNVVVSAYLSDEGYERYVLDLVLAGKLDLGVSAAILAEYEGVLRRKKFGISASKVRGSMRLMRKAARLVSPRVSVCAATAPEDNKFLECASRPTPNIWSPGTSATSRRCGGACVS